MLASCDEPSGGVVMQANSEVVSRAPLPEDKNRGPCLVQLPCAKYSPYY